MKLLIAVFYSPPVTDSILGPNISLRTNLPSLLPSWVQIFPSGPTSPHFCLLGSKIFLSAPSSSHFLPLGSKYSPHHPLKTPRASVPPLQKQELGPCKYQIIQVFYQWEVSCWMWNNSMIPCKGLKHVFYFIYYKYGLVDYITLHYITLHIISFRWVHRICCKNS